MNKIKVGVLIALLIGLTACSEDNYVSTRHPEGESQEVTDQALEEENDPLEEASDQSTENQEDEASSENTEEESENSEEENQEESEAKGDGINYTVEGEVNVRLAPSENSNILTTVNEGDDILKLGESDNWSRISINGQTGYIRSDLLKAK